MAFKLQASSLQARELPSRYCTPSEELRSASTYYRTTISNMHVPSGKSLLPGISLANAFLSLPIENCIEFLNLEKYEPSASPVGAEES
jgi:hypothetical protein